MPTLSAPTVRFAADVKMQPSSIPAFKYATETYTVSGLTTDMVPCVTAPSLESGLILVGEVVSASNTLKLTFWNPTSASISPANQTFQVLCF